MSEQTEVTQSQNESDNSLIKHLRSVIDQKEQEKKDVQKNSEDLQSQLKDLQSQLKELQTKDLDEVEKLRGQLEETKTSLGTLEQVKAEFDAANATLEGIYETELQAIPEDKREQVKALSSYGSWPDRIKLLREAKNLIPEPTISVAGTKTQPPGGSPPLPDKAALDPKNPPSWGEAFANVKAS